jgi:UPF0755 protein
VVRLLIQSLKLVVIAVVALLMIYAGRQVWESIAGTAKTPSTETVTIRIRPGDGPAEITETLEKANVIRFGFIFRTLVRLRNASSKFTAGEHQLVRGMSMNQVIDVLTAPPDLRLAEVTVTFPEGLRVEEYAAILKKNGLVESEELFLKATREDYDFDFLRFRPSGVGLEGYLFPDTYRILRGTKPRDIVIKMLENFGRKVPADLRARAESQQRTIHQIIVLASIVEKEARRDDERAKIAGVYTNRLTREMPLQADPTVQYIIGKAGNWWPRDNALVNALRVPHDFNTYLKPGLPPGPIANPGRAAIEAALGPERHDLLYFVAKDDGSHAFAKTLDEHNANVRKFQP